MTKSKPLTVQLTEQLADHLRQNLLEKGFSYNPKESSFCRQSENCIHRISLHIIRKPWGSYQIAFYLSATFEELETLFARVEPNPAFKSRATVAHFTQNESPLRKGPDCLSGSWLIHDPTDFSKIVGLIDAFVMTYAIAWFDKYCNLDATFESFLACPEPPGDDCFNLNRIERALLIAIVQNDSVKLERVMEKVRPVPEDQSSGFWKFYERAQAVYPDLLE